MQKKTKRSQSLKIALLISASFSLLGNEIEAFAAANPAGAGIGNNPNGNGRVIPNDGQSNSLNEIVTPGNSATANGTGAIELAGGFLALDAVPDLHFAPSFGGSQGGNLLNNSRGGYVGTDYNDGNSHGKLQVSDYRYSGEPYNPATSKPLNGWTLFAKLGYFSPIGGNGVPSSISSDPNYNDSGAAAYGGVAPTSAPTHVGADDWAIYLNNSQAANQRNVANGSNFRSNVFLSAAPMSDYPKKRDVNYETSSTLLAGGPQVKIWWTPQSITNAVYGGYGKTVAYYDAASTASLKVGKKANDGYYYAPLTWTLMAGSH